MQELTRRIKVSLGKKTSLKEDIRKCNDEIHAAGAAFLKEGLWSRTHYAMSELVRMNRREAIYRITLIPNMERLGKEQTHRKVR